MIDAPALAHATKLVERLVHDTPRPLRIAEEPEDLAEVDSVPRDPALLLQGPQEIDCLLPQADGAFELAGRDRKVPEVREVGGHRRAVARLLPQCMALLEEGSR